MVRQLPAELIHAVISAGLESTEALYQVDERRSKVRNRDFLLTCTLVGVVWNAFATPLLFASLVVDTPADDEARFIDQPKSTSSVAPPTDRRRSLLRLLQARPDLAALVREVDFPAGQVGQFAPQFWPLVRTLRLASISDLGWLPLPLARAVIFPVPFKLDRLAFTSRLSPLHAPLARLAAWVDLSQLTRLDISTSGEGHSLRHALEGAKMPYLVDLRVVTSQNRNDSGHIEAILRTFGRQLRKFAIFDTSGRRPNMPNVRGLCPNLQELALSDFRMHSYGYPINPSAPPQALDRLLLGPPWFNPADQLTWEPILPPAERKLALAAVAYFRPRRLALASLGAGALSDVDQTIADRFLDALRAETDEDIILEDRFGRAVAGGPSRGASTPSLVDKAPAPATLA